VTTSAAAGQQPEGETRPPPAPVPGVSGRILAEGSGEPIPEAWVELLREDGRAVTRIPSDEEGRFLLRPPVPGEYRLRVSRKGYRFLVTSPFSVAEDRGVERELSLEPLPSRDPGAGEGSNP